MLSEAKVLTLRLEPCSSLCRSRNKDVYI